jgi:multicomponent Na+:H+ antiporter subunit D
MSTEALPALAVLLPLLLAVLLFVVPTHWRRTLGIGGTFVIAATTLRLVTAVFWGGEIELALGGWQAPLGIVLRADGMTAIFLGLTTLVALTLALHAPWWFARHDPAGSRVEAWFWPLWGFQWAALHLVFVAGDLFTAYIGLELSGLAAVALITLGGRRVALEAALRYLLLALLGSLLYLLGVALLYGAGGALDLVILADTLAPGAAPHAALILMTLGLLIKTALVPFHFWLPAAHANAPAPVSAILSALVIKAAFALLLRVWFELFVPLGVGVAGELLGGLGIIAIVWGSLQAIRQRRLKRLVAWSTVAQVGYLFLIFALATEAAWTGTLLHALAHGLAKAAMFLAAGNVLLAFGHDRIRGLYGAAGQLPITFFTFAIAGVSLMGLPPSGGFIAKWLLLGAALDDGRWPYALAIVAGSLLAAGYLFPLLRTALAGSHDPRQQRPARLLPVALELPPLLLAMVALLLGLAAYLPIALLGPGMPEAW